MKVKVGYIRVIPIYRPPKHFTGVRGLIFALGAFLLLGCARFENSDGSQNWIIN